MPHWQKRFIPAAVVLLLIGLLYVTRSTPDTTLIGTDIKGTRVVYDGKPTPAASISIPFTRKDDAYTVANVAVDLNKDGKIAAYTTVGGTQQEWVVQNSRAKVFEGGNTFSFDIQDADVATRGDFRVVAMLTAVPVEDWSGKPHGKSAATEAKIAFFEPEDFAPLFTPQAGPLSAGGFMDAPPSSADGTTPVAPKPGPAVKTRGNEPWLSDTSAGAEPVPGAAAAVGAEPAATAPPAAGSDYSVFQPGVPDMSQGHNECVPTSISNGLTWLGERYGFTDKLPATQLATREEIKGDLNWRSDYGADMGNNVINAKVAFSRRHGLPIVTHQIGTTLSADIVRHIAAELRKGQAVEIGIGYYTQDAAGAWNRQGGHMFSGVGAFGQDGREYVGVHDPLSPEAGRLDMYEVSGARLLNYRYRGNTRVFIEYAYAQSPTAEWAAQHPPRVALDTDAAVEAQNLEDTMIVDAIKIGADWYPVKQFHSGTGPECDDQEHWHANAGTAWGVDRAGFDPSDLNNPERVYRARRDIKEWTDPDGCGAGKTAEVTRRTVLISEEEAGQLVSKVVQ